MLEMLPLRTTLTIDSDMKGCWYNAQIAWLRRGKLPYHLVLQDDLEIPPNFEIIVNNVIKALPDHVISLYSPRWVTKRKTSNWCVQNGLNGQAVLMPTAFVDEWLSWTKIYCVVKPQRIFNSYDNRLSLWLHFNNKVCYFPIPSIVQHIGTDSTLFGTTHNKNSALYPEDPACLKDIHWEYGKDTPAVHSYKYTREYQLIKPEYLSSLIQQKDIER